MGLMRHSCIPGSLRMAIKLHSSKRSETRLPLPFPLASLILRATRKCSVPAGLTRTGLPWRPDGKEIWFTARKTGVLAIQAVDLSGHERFLFASPDVLMIQDVLKDGSVLVINGNWPETTICQPPGETVERNVSWFDYTTGKGLTSDGKTLLFDEGGAVFGSIFLRKSDGSEPAVRIGEGYAMTLSPDGKWVIAQSFNTPGKLL